MAWKGETEEYSYGISHKGICPLLKQWRQVVKGKVTAESAWPGLREAMVEYLRAAVSAEPEGSTMAAPSAAGEDEGGA
jgi:hypothetical protein